MMDLDGYAVSVLSGRAIFDKDTNKEEISKWLIEQALKNTPKGFMVVNNESSIGLYENELFYKVKYKEAFSNAT